MGFKVPTDEELELELEKAALENAANFGAPENVWHNEFGWIVMDGKITQQYIKMMEKKYKK